jgi:hypothetical protein
MSTTVPCILRSHTVLPLSFFEAQSQPIFHPIRWCMSNADGSVTYVISPLRARLTNKPYEQIV